MKKILIISPHFPPSNLAAVHRSRLFAQHLPSFGWQPTILTVHENFYEEKPDHNLTKLLPGVLRIEKVKAFNISKRRLIGDIGLRSFFQLYKRAKQLIREEGFDFLYIPIPPFYIALLGRWLHASTGIKYGIDYIDPWVHEFAGSEKLFSRHWLSTKIARMLEPIAIKKVSLITGVAEGYYQEVIHRNPYLMKRSVFGAMPYGGEITDHEKLAGLNIQPYLFTKKPGKIQLVYAGALLPKAYALLEVIFKSVIKDLRVFSPVEIHFIGTGIRANNTTQHTVKPMAEKYDLWNTVIFEHPGRIPYMDVLVHLDAADGVFILGSTEPHYTPSKVYQGVLSKKPILAVLHKNSTAVKVLNDSGAGIVLEFNGESDIRLIEDNFPRVMDQYLRWMKTFDSGDIKLSVFEEYSAKSITKQLASLLNNIEQ